MLVSHKSLLVTLIVVFSAGTVLGQASQKRVVDYIRDGIAAQEAGKHGEAVRELCSRTQTRAE